MALAACQGSDDDPVPDVPDVVDEGGSIDVDEPDATDAPPEVAEDVAPDLGQIGAPGLTRTAPGVQQSSSGRYRLITATSPATADPMRSSRFELRRSAR